MKIEYKKMESKKRRKNKIYQNIRNIIRTHKITNIRIQHKYKNIRINKYTRI